MKGLQKAIGTLVLVSTLPIVFTMPGVATYPITLASGICAAVVFLNVPRNDIEEQENEVKHVSDSEKDRARAVSC